MVEINEDLEAPKPPVQTVAPTKASDAQTIKFRGELADYNWVQEYTMAGEAGDTPQNVVDATIDEVLSISDTRLGLVAKKITVLDVGCGRGQYSESLAKRVGKVVSTEPYRDHFEKAEFVAKKYDNFSVYNLPAENLPDCGPFDLAISLTTVEHMPKARESMARVIELLRPGGILYLTAPNKLWPIECHYQLPFLAVLPLPLANLYLRITGKGNSYLSCSYSRTYWGMKRLFKGLDCKVEFYLPDPKAAYLGCGQTGSVAGIIRTFGMGLIRRFPIFWSISKGFIIVITKNSQNAARVR